MTRPGMHMPSPHTRPLWAVVACAALFGCATVTAPPVPAAGPPAAAAPAPPAPARAFVPSTGLHWYRTAAERRALAVQAYRLATDRVEAAAARTHGAWGVILDIDDTVLDISEFEREVAMAGRFAEGAFETWCRKKSAPAVPGARAFLERVHALGGRVALVSNRLESSCDVTRENLAAEHMPFDEVLCRLPGERDKSRRFAAVANGTPPSILPPLEVVLWVGDNIQDFPGMTQAALRDAPDAAFTSFGERYVILPNPMYGSWEKNPDR